MRTKVHTEYERRLAQAAVAADPRKAAAVAETEAIKAAVSSQTIILGPIKHRNVAPECLGYISTDCLC